MRRSIPIFVCLFLSSCSLLDTNSNSPAQRDVTLTLQDGVGMVISSENKRWELKKSPSLKAEMIRWANSVDWDLDWRISEDYPVLFSANFEGPLIGNESVLTKVIEAVKERTGRPLHVSFKRGNKVIVIEDGGYWVKN